MCTHIHTHTQTRSKAAETPASKLGLHHSSNSLRARAETIGSKAAAGEEEEARRPKKSESEEDEEELDNLRQWGHLMEHKGSEAELPHGKVTLIKVDTKIHKGSFFTKTLTPAQFREDLALLRVVKM